MLRIYALLSICILFCIGAFAQAPHQERANDKEVNAFVEKTYPKLWKELKKIEKEGTAVEFFTSMKGPGRAGKEKIQLNQSYFNQPRPAFPEDRLIVVVLHEYGHILHAKKCREKGGTQF
ncbi:hypothetical protein [Niabella ginsengisoli]|uniref:Uncharacterized protein n=1 Tax=Niabella ginsengisoli TaxID=522298 RepID=A0ABS9SNL6_9BACT|nr:hypothetical protein [Niabella ginsengisoli]MCH5599971.1 hypothetical protein [Niabella ginsengisoli]